MQNKNPENQNGKSHGPNKVAKVHADDMDKVCATANSLCFPGSARCVLGSKLARREGADLPFSAIARWGMEEKEEREGAIPLTWQERCGHQRKSNHPYDDTARTQH